MIFCELLGKKRERHNYLSQIINPYFLLPEERRERGEEGGLPAFFLLREKGQFSLNKGGCLRNERRTTHCLDAVSEEGREGKISCSLEKRDSAKLCLLTKGEKEIPLEKSLSELCLSLVGNSFEGGKKKNRPTESYLQERREERVRSRNPEGASALSEEEKSLYLGKRSSNTSLRGGESLAL